MTILPIDRARPRQSTQDITLASGRSLLSRRRPRGTSRYLGRQIVADIMRWLHFYPPQGKI